MIKRFRLFALCLLFADVAALANDRYLVFIGTYTEKASEGIYVVDFDAATGKLSEPRLAVKTKQPSFVAIHPRGKYLYAVNETPTGEVSAFTIDQGTGDLTLLNKQPSGGADPAHLSLDRTGRFLLVANYSGGSIATFPIQADGKLGARISFVQHAGSSVNPERQKEPHAHAIQAAPDNEYVVAVDLGLDQLLVYPFDAKSGRLAPRATGLVKMTPGAGPRHLAFHPNGKYAYAMNELDSTLSVMRYRGDGRFEKLQTLPTLPPDFKGENTTAEVVVHPSGKFVYGSNRGHDSIVAYAIGKDGTLTLIDHTPTQGRKPRNFAIDPTGRWMFVANQDTDSVVLFRVDPRSGRLTPTGTAFNVSMPVCVRFLARK